MKYEYDNVDKLNSVEVTLSMGCKLNCRFCPQKVLLDRYFSANSKRASMMNFDTFKKITDKVKNGGTICFSGMCEPFHNPQCDDMILYAYEKGFRINLLTTLVGMKKQSIEKLSKVEFDTITLHIPDREGNSKFVISDEYLQILESFHDTFEITSYSCHGEIHPKIQKYINKNSAYSNTMINRAGNLDCGLNFKPKGEIICMVGTIGSYGNWTPEILPDGTVLLCCMDYGMKHVLGNLIDMNVKDILEGREYQMVQRGMREEGLDILCRKCSGAMELERIPAYRFKTAKRRYLQEKSIKSKLDSVLALFAESRNICIFGLGKLFWDNFFQQRWNEVLGHTYYCDNSAELWGREIDGIKCISPKELSTLDNLLVVTHISDDESVRRQLREIGVKNIINIKEIYKMLQEEQNV